MNRHRPGSQEDARRSPCGDWISLLRLGCVSCTCKHRDGCGDAASPTLRSVRTHIVGSRTRAERHVAALSSARSDGPAATGALWGCAGRSIRRRAMDPSGDIHRTDSPSLPAFHTPSPIRLRLRAIHRDSSPPSSLSATASQPLPSGLVTRACCCSPVRPSRGASSPRSTSYLVVSQRPRTARDRQERVAPRCCPRLQSVVSTGQEWSDPLRPASPPPSLSDVSFGGRLSTSRRF
jgi:hypothetical protein